MKTEEAEIQNTPHEVTIIWIVEDDEYLRQSYMSIINSSTTLKVTKTFRSGEEAIKNLKTEQPNLILMDIELPGKSGVDCTGLIKELYPQVQIVIVTVYDDSELVFKSLTAGASGYITKSSNYEQLIAGINEIVAGGSPMSSKIARMVIESFHKNYASPLTKREEEILKLVASGKTFTQISEQLFIARETTKTHIRNIYRKLEVDCKADAIAKASKQHFI
jgi:DNA-binding NarL/FixJ family response regulator